VVVGLGKQRRKQHAAIVPNMIETQLVGQNGFSGAWLALNDIGRPCNKTALEQSIKASDSAFKAF
jgi:hypothetical protein